MIYLAAAIVLALFYLQQWGFTRERELRAQTFDFERAQWAAERSKLLDRIQAPEIAVAPEAEEGEKQYVSLDDDADFWAATE